MMKLLLLISLVSYALSFTSTTETEEKLQEQINMNINIGEGGMTMKHKHMLEKKKMELANRNKKAAASASTSTKSKAKEEPAAATPTTDAAATTTDAAATPTTDAAATPTTDASGSGSTATQKPPKINKDGPIYYTTWAKYFKYRSTDKDVPKQFFINNSFYEQLKVFPDANLSAKSDDQGNEINTYVKTETSFYLAIFKHNINFLSSRQAQLQKTFDTLYLDQIKPISEGNFDDFSEKQDSDKDKKREKPGIEDFGNFSEGYCFRINTINNYTWVICTEDANSKLSLMSVFKKFLLENQRSHGEIVLPPTNMAEAPTISGMMQPTSQKNGTFSATVNGALGSCAAAGSAQVNIPGVVKNGYWVIIQNWTPCSLRCGGGTSTMQRLCVPPSPGGKPCVGPSIITRPCNTNACPDPKQHGRAGVSVNVTETVMKPIVKVLPFSSRPQRFNKCIVKESDLMYTQSVDDKSSNNDDINFDGTYGVKKIQIPVRVVMNNRTISIFAGDEYTSMVKSFRLSKTVLQKSNRENCFVLKQFFKSPLLNDKGEAEKRDEDDKPSTAELCPFGFVNSSKDLEEWTIDFKIFKVNCHTKVETKKEGPGNWDEELQKKLNDKMKQARRELLEEREDALSKKAKDLDKKEADKSLEKAQRDSISVMEKENNIEQMVKQEEEDREKREEQDLMENIDAENKKKCLLVKAIKERELENQYNMREREKESEVQAAKEEAAKQIEEKREKLKKQITDMQKKANRKKNQLRQKLQSVRMSMANEMGKAYKSGDGSKCKPANSEGGSDEEAAKQQEYYCQANFMEDLSQYSLCKETDDFCDFCCNTEFGDMHMDKRQKCITDNCPKSDFSNGDGKKSGQWIWHDDIKNKNDPLAGSKKMK